MIVVESSFIHMNAWRFVLLPCEEAFPSLCKSQNQALACVLEGVVRGAPG